MQDSVLLRIYKRYRKNSLTRCPFDATIINTPLPRWAQFPPVGIAGIAQSVEQLIRNQQVVSSSLISSSTATKKAVAQATAFFVCSRRLPSARRRLRLPLLPPQQPGRAQQQGEVSALPQHPQPQGGQGEGQDFGEPPAHLLPGIGAGPAVREGPQDPPPIQRAHGEEVEHAKGQAHPRQQVGISPAKVAAPGRCPQGQEEAGRLPGPPGIPPSRRRAGASGGG